MREIKFRAWDNVKKEMMGEVWEIRFSNKHSDVENVVAGDRQSENFTLMQFTGLRDKNGKEIYEGDIVKENRFSSLSQVIWSQGEGSLVGKVKGLFGEESDLTGFIHELGKFEFKGIKGITKAHYIGEFEVIGNIYENPELLTKNL